MSERGWKNYALSVSGGLLMLFGAVGGWIFAVLWYKVDTVSTATADLRVQQARTDVKVGHLEAALEEIKVYLKKIEANTRR